LSIELERQGVAFLRQAPVAVKYRGIQVGHGYLDFLVEGCVVLELKAVDELHPKHTAQVLSYLKATDLRLGLLVNFQAPFLKEGLRRLIL
ncbi:MAG: GxxExxY protein, partial [Phycisphaeraceae bacterium]